MPHVRPCLRVSLGSVVQEGQAGRTGRTGRNKRGGAVGRRMNKGRGFIPPAFVLREPRKPEAVEAGCIGSSNRAVAAGAARSGRRKSDAAAAAAAAGRGVGMSSVARSR